MQIGRKYQGNNIYTSDIVVLACTLFGQGSGTTVYAQMGWYEL
jgi:hypothetical protein